MWMTGVLGLKWEDKWKDLWLAARSGWADGRPSYNAMNAHI